MTATDSREGPDLDRLTELEQLATPGPWGPMEQRFAFLWSMFPADIVLAVALRNAALALIAAARERDQLRATVERVGKLADEWQRLAEDITDPDERTAASAAAESLRDILGGDR